MLIEKSKFKKGDIVSAKLVTGEEVIGTYITENTECIDLDKPYKLIQTEGQQFGFAPVMVTTDPEKLHTIYKTAIAIITPTYKEIKIQYDAAVKSIAEPTFEEVGA